MVGFKFPACRGESVKYQTCLIFLPTLPALVSDPNFSPLATDLEIEGQGHKTIAFVALPIYTHIPNLKGLTKMFFKLLCPKGNLCGGGVTVLNPKYPRLSSRQASNYAFLESRDHCLHGRFQVPSQSGRVGKISNMSDISTNVTGPCIRP